MKSKLADSEYLHVNSSQWVPNHLGKARPVTLRYLLASAAINTILARQPAFWSVLKHGLSFEMWMIILLIHLKGEHWWKTIFKEGEGGYKQISLAPKLVENSLLIRSFSPPKLKKKIFCTPCTYFALQVDLSSDLLYPAGESQIGPT